jgi:hypothetical protein
MSKPVTLAERHNAITLIEAIDKQKIQMMNSSLAKLETATKNVKSDELTSLINLCRQRMMSTINSQKEFGNAYNSTLRALEVVKDLMSSYVEIIKPIVQKFPDSETVAAALQSAGQSPEQLTQMLTQAYPKFSGFNDGPVSKIMNFLRGIGKDSQIETAIQSLTNDLGGFVTGLMQLGPQDAANLLKVASDVETAAASAASGVQPTTPTNPTASTTSATTTAGTTGTEQTAGAAQQTGTSASAAPASAEAPAAGGGGQQTLMQRFAARQGTQGQAAPAAGGGTAQPAAAGPDNQKISSIVKTLNDGNGINANTLGIAINSGATDAELGAAIKAFIKGRQKRRLRSSFARTRSPLSSWPLLYM